MATSMTFAELLYTSRLTNPDDRWRDEWPGKASRSVVQLNASARGTPGACAKNRGEITVWRRSCGLEHGATALGDQMSLIGKLTFSGLLFILIGLLVALIWAVVNGIMLGLSTDSPERAHAVVHNQETGPHRRAARRPRDAGHNDCVFFNGILVTWNVK